MRNDVYDYTNATADPLVVDFANRHLGGGCFNKGFVQEEQMILQSFGFASVVKLLHQNAYDITYGYRANLGDNEARIFENIQFDAWWSRKNAGTRVSSFDPGHMKQINPKPLTILAINAPDLSWREEDNGTAYDTCTLLMLTQKILLMYALAKERGSPVVFTGLLGGGAFRNNRPLVLLLHLLLQPCADGISLSDFPHASSQAFGEAG